MSDTKTQTKTRDVPVPEAPKTKRYITDDTSPVLFDVLVHGETVFGQWDEKKSQHVAFDVPEDLVAGFEKHWNFTSGKIVAA